jgi:CCR4-NOT complex subunit CAF16
MGSATLLIGGNGVGKSTLLKLIAGRHLLASGMVEVFGHSPFEHVFSLAEVALVDGDFPIHVDLKVSELLSHPSPGVQRELEAELLQLLEINPAWRMHRVSEGQRRRVQLLLALRRPVKLLLLDEVTSHLDVVARADLLQWLKIRRQSQAMTLIYTTHILDGLGDKTGIWPTHIGFLGAVSRSFHTEIGAIPELASLSLLQYSDDKIRADRIRHP